MSEVTPRLAQVVLDTSDARRAAEFWRQLLGLAHRDGHQPPGPDEDDHLDLTVGSRDELEAAHQKALALGGELRLYPLTTRGSRSGEASDRVVARAV